MELLVREEIERQIKFYPKALKSYLNTVEVATYALNRLPPLYASCLAGKEQQLRLGRTQHKNDIIGAVRRALAAIERDPLRVSQPIVTEKEINLQKADTARLAIEKILHDRQLLDETGLTWDNLADAIQRAINKVTWRIKQTETDVEETVSFSTYRNDRAYQEYVEGDLEEEDGWFCERSHYLM